MNRTRKIFLNITVIIISFTLFLMFTGYSLTAKGAFKNSERTGNYGPSEIVHIEEFKGGKHYLGKYDKWFSGHTVYRDLFFFWRYGNQVSGMENDLSKALSYSWEMSEKRLKFYGIINDPNISKIEITLESGDMLSTEEFYDDMFLMTWDNKEEGVYIQEIRAYDENEDLIFEDILW